MIRTLLHFVGRWLRRLLKGVLWLVVAYPFLLVAMYFTTDAFFPNGAELNRNIDWERLFRYGFYRTLLTRGDLYLPNGQLIARRVDLLCWNETAVSGLAFPRGFIWLGGDHEVIYTNDPGYSEAIETSGLHSGPLRCGGPLRPVVNAETLLGRWMPMRPDQ